MKVRWMAVILAAVLTVTTLSCVAAAEGKTPREKLTEDLMNGLAVYEQMYGDMLWALDYVEIFDATRQWSDLLNARAALNAVLMDILKMTPPEQTLTEADMKALMEEGIDASFVLEYGLTFEADRNEMLDTCFNYNNYILYHVFTKDVWNHAVAHMQLFNEMAEDYLQYSGVTVDWLTTQTGDEAWIDKLSGEFATRCPMSSQRRMLGIFDEADTVAQADKILKRQEELDVALNKSEAEIRHLLDKYDDANEAGTIDALLVNNITSISDLPTLVPEADWDDIIYPDIDLNKIDLASVKREDLLAQDHLYLWRSGKDELRQPAVLDPLDAPPDVCVIATRKVARESVEEYCAGLDVTEGIERVDLTGDSETLRVTYQAGQSVFVVEWEEDTIIVYLLEDPVCFVPGWYYNVAAAGKNNHFTSE